MANANGNKQNLRKKPTMIYTIATSPEIYFFIHRWFKKFHRKRQRR